VEFSVREVRDLAVAWLALGVAFAFFFARGEVGRGPGGVPAVNVDTFAPILASSLVTVGVAFLLHELAHKVVAVRFDQVAEFRADYGMLFIAVAGGLAGFIFAAPGAVHHRGYLTDREHGLIALAGPVTNYALALLFLPVVLVAPDVGWRGVGINVLLAGFNMLPFGPLDGRTVLSWSKVVFAVALAPALVVVALALGLV
jgi:Zn-dependent protease